MRVFFCGNGPSAVAIGRYLAGRDDARLVGCAVHPAGRARNVDEIRALCGGLVLVGPEINSERGLARLRELTPDVILSVHFGYVLGRDVLGAVRYPLNLHPSLLPHGRGANPDVWTIVEGAPAGVTLHVMAEKVDAGEILAQCRIASDWTDTAETLYRRLLAAELELFEQAWPPLVAGELTPSPQRGGGSRHTTKELQRLDRLDPDEVTTVRDLLNRLRARTFPPHDGCYIESDSGERTYFRLFPYREPGEPGGGSR